MKTLILIVIVVSVFMPAESNPCTIVMVSDSTVALAGSNEDSVFPLTLVWYVPATDSTYARVCLCYNMILNSVQGGMNEKGLFVDGNSLGGQGWESNEDKQALSGSVLDNLLATCADVEEVKEYFNTYNVPALDVARIPVMDKSGASMIVEWYNGEVVFLESDKTYQVSTNFIGSKYTGDNKPCERYNKAIEILETQDTFSVDSVSDVLDSTHVESNRSTTVYSFTCDLKNGDIYIYNYHDFSRPLRFNLEEELANGQHQHYLAELFADRSADYEEFIANGPAWMIERGYRRNINSALMFFNLLKSQYPKAFHREIGVETLSRVGMNLVAYGKLDDAIKMLEQNVQEFPDSARSHFELGDVYSKNQQPEKAVSEFEKALVIDPDHLEARQALEELQ
jgi:hypothetical protein